MFKKFLLLTLLALSISSIHAQTVAYVIGFNSVTALNVPANTTAATIPAGPPQFILNQAIVASPDGTRVYALYQNGGVVLVIDAAANTPVATITGAGTAPIGLAISPDGARLYVADLITGVVIIDTATNTVVGSPIAVTGFAGALAITPNGTRLYVGSQVSNIVTIVDTATNTVVGSPIAIGCTPQRMAVTPNGTQLYVACSSPGQTVTISTASNTVTASIPFDGIDFRLAITPDGSQVYVSGLTGANVGVIDTATNTLTTTIPVGTFPTGIAVTPDGASVYVTVRSTGTATVIDTTTNTITATGIPVGGSPQDITIFNPTAPFAAFTVEDLDIKEHKLNLDGDFTLGASSSGLDLAHQATTLTVGTFSITIPAGSFKQVGGQSHFILHGTISGLKVDADLKAEHGSSTAFDYKIQVKGVDVDVANPVTVTLKIGENTGTTTVNQ
jgi:YVTN family beta-propeller protein